MAAPLRKVRYDWFFRHFNDSGRWLWHGFVTRNTLVTSAFHSYSKSLPIMARKWSESGPTVHVTHGFPNRRPPDHSFRGNGVGSKSIAKGSRYRREEQELDSDAETDSEDEEGLSDKSWKSKKGPGKRGKSWKLKSQKSAGNVTLRPSKYLFKYLQPEQEEENRWERRKALEDRKGKVNWYARQMLRLTQEGKVDEALNLLASMKANKLHPRVEVYNIFISAYAKRGQVRKAFKIFNDVKKRGLKPTAHTFSSLFNACTKASTPEHALRHVEKLLAEIRKRTANQELEMNVITYNAAIQALVICGDPLQAFDIYQEMQDNEVEPDGHTFSSLLAACSFDKVEGPSAAFKLLEEMKSLQIQPDIYIFNSVLKVMRDFKVSTEDQRSQLLRSRPSADVTEESSKEHDLMDHDEEASESISSKLNYEENTLQNRNNDASKNDSDLQLHHYFPGVEKFIQMMAVENVSPDVRTFHLLLYMTSSKQEEGYLMELMSSCNISPDATFYNTLIKKKATEEGFQEAKVYMQELKETLKIAPSEKSYHALAHGCKRQKQGLALLDQMKSEGIATDQTVYGILISGAAKDRQFSYLIQLIKRMSCDDVVQPNDRMMEVLQRAYNLPCYKPVIAGTMDERLVKLRKFRFLEQRRFQTFFKDWRTKVLMGETMIRETGKGSHIEQYAQDTVDEKSDDVSDDEISNDDIDSKFSHL